MVPGLVVGPWGEGSKDLHSLVKVLAETKLAAKARALGRQMSDKELGVIVNQVRKNLSTSFARAQSLCLINRLSYLVRGPRQLQEGGLWPNSWKRVGGGIDRPPTWPTSGGEGCPERDKSLCKLEPIMIYQTC